MLLYVLVGGTQTAWGPLVGAAFFTLLPEVLRPAAAGLVSLFDAVTGHAHGAYKPDDSWRFVFLGVLTVAIMALRPGGIVLRTTVAALRFRPRRVAAPIELRP